MLPQGEVGQAEIVIGPWIGRRQADGLPVVLNRRFMMLGTGVGIAPAVIGVSGLRGDFDRLATIRDGQFQIAQAAIGLTALTVRIDKWRMGGNGLGEGFDGVFVCFTLKMPHPVLKGLERRRRNIWLCNVWLRNVWLRNCNTHITP